MNDKEIKQISFNIIFKKYESFLPNDRKDYYHMYDFLFHKAMNDKTFIPEIVSYFELGILGNIFKKIEIFQMIRFSHFFFEENILKNSELVRNNDDVNFIIQLLNYIDEKDWQTQANIQSHLQMSEFKNLNEKIMKLETSIEQLRNQNYDLEKKIYNFQKGIFS